MRSPQLSFLLELAPASRSRKLDSIPVHAPTFPSPRARSGPDLNTTLPGRGRVEGPRPTRPIKDLDPNGKCGSLHQGIMLISPHLDWDRPITRAGYTSWSMLCQRQGCQRAWLGTGRKAHIRMSSPGICTVGCLPERGFDDGPLMDSRNHIRPLECGLLPRQGLSFESV